MIDPPVDFELRPHEQDGVERIMIRWKDAVGVTQAVIFERQNLANLKNALASYFEQARP